MRILIASSEAVPFAKTGGLADVTGSLLKEFRKKNEKASLILPLYTCIKKKHKLFSTGKSVSIKMGDIILSGNILTSEKSEYPSAYFIDCDELFGRDELYGTSKGEYADNAIRFIFFSRAVIVTCIAINIRPDIVHCNDWQTAMIPLYLKTIYKGINNFKKTSTLYTVHNLGYQGVFDASALPYTGLGRDYFTLEGLEFYGKLNLMKSGLIYSSLISTVSNTYAKEILEPENGFGLDGVLRKRKGDLFGIINGIDYNEWDPGKDMFLTSRYTFRDLKGKIKCRETLLNKAKLNDEKLPLIGMISRLSVQKGLDLVLGSVEELMDMGVNIIVLGKGEDNYQNFFVKASKKYKGRFFTDIGFEESLAHLIYAGCDFFLMPSKYEPCGLGQLIAMRYGTIPIARKTGGLADTIQDYNHLLSEGSGYLFNDFTASAMQDAVKRALCVFTDKRKMRKMVHDVMNADFSWEVSADKYLDLYKKCVKKVIK